MTRPDPLDPQLIDRYLAGTASEGDVRAVLDWMAIDPRNRILIEGIVASGAADTLSLSTDESWRAVNARMRSATPMVYLEPRQARANRLSHDTRPAAGASSTSRMLLRFAATLALCTGGAFAWRATRAATTHEIVAALGKPTMLTLADGSHVTLSPGSRISWRGDFGARSRELALTGEGYFAVVHDAAKPFRVRAQSGIAEDIGTKFVVRAWSRETPIEVAVQEGAVSLSDSAPAARLTARTLRAGDRGQLDRTGVVAVTRDADALLAWTRGELVFSDTPLADALPEISRWYNTDLRAAPALSARRLNARFLAQPLPDLINALSLALDARAVRDGQHVTLVPNTP